MANKRSPIWEQYGKPSAANPEYQILTCPEEGCGGKEFDGLADWKRHMQTEHGGYTADELADSLPTGGGHADGDQTSSATAKPKKVTARARELNDKFNEALNLLMKHFMDGLTEADKVRLDLIRGEVSSAIVGVEFDFEERLVKISSKLGLAVALAALWLLPYVPSFKELAAKAKESAEKGKGDAK